MAILTRTHALLRSRGIEVRDDILVKPLASVPMPDEMMDELAKDPGLIVCGISDWGSCSLGSSLDSILLQRRGAAGIAAGPSAMSAAARARRPHAPPFIDPPGYGRHRPEQTLLFQLVEQHYPPFRELRAAADRPLPDFVQQEFDAYLKRGRLEEDFLRVRCERCHCEKLVTFSCKKRGFCPSCGGRRMAETAALLADEVLPERP